jgi:rhamnosyltransferase
LAAATFSSSKRSGVVSDKPTASVTVLTKNPGHGFRTTLDAIFKQECATSFEVVVVDSGSTDGTLDLATQYPVSIYSIAPDEFNFGRTRDYAFSLTRGDFIVAISQDAVPAGTSWLENLIHPFVDRDIALVQGTEQLAEDRDLFYWGEMDLFYYTRESQRWKAGHGGVGVSFVNCAIRRSVWEENRLPDIEVMEDKVFQVMLDARGHRICQQPDAKVFHSHSYSLASLARRCENEGLGWKIAGQNYSALDMVRDILKPAIWRLEISGIVRRQVTTMSELMFPLVRPLFLFYGNHFLDRYVY